MRKFFTIFSVFFTTIHILPFQAIAEIIPSDTIRKEYVEINTGEEVKVYPIPVEIGQDLKFTFNQQSFTTIQVEITDLLGQVLLENQITAVAPFLPNIQLNAGTYFIRIHLNEKIILRRIIVTKN